MRRLFLAVLMLMPIASISRAHLCDNVFAQAKDNLVVKVDIRDGQLRIGREASFRVYVLNTMDRDIVEIALEVQSEQFDANVTPSPDWNRHPMLRTTVRGGKKEYFTVTLRRKAGVPDGSYRIGLNLVSRRQKMTFRTLDLDAAADISSIPKAEGITVDGRATPQEWGKSFICTNFYAYRRVGRYMENVAAPEQTRMRMSYDENYIYFLTAFQGANDAQADSFSIYIAPTSDDDPNVVTIDRPTGRITGAEDVIQGATAAVGPDRSYVEGRLSRESLGIKEVNSFLMNFTRTITRENKRETTYWRGNDASVNQPIVYGQFIFEE